MRLLRDDEIAEVSGGLSLVDNNDPALYNSAWQDTTDITVSNPNQTFSTTLHTQSLSTLPHGYNSHISPNDFADGPDITITARHNGGVSVIINNPLIYNAGLPFFVGGGGTISGTIPKGATMTGRDANNNGIPDALESMILKGNAHFLHSNPGSGHK